MQQHRMPDLRRRDSIVYGWDDPDEHIHSSGGLQGAVEALRGEAAEARDVVFVAHDEHVEVKGQGGVVGCVAGVG